MPFFFSVVQKAHLWEQTKFLKSRQASILHSWNTYKNCLTCLYSNFYNSCTGRYQFTQKYAPPSALRTRSLEAAYLRTDSAKGLKEPELDSILNKQIPTHTVPPCTSFVVTKLSAWAVQRQSRAHHHYTGHCRGGGARNTGRDRKDLWTTINEWEGGGDQVFELKARGSLSGEEWKGLNWMEYWIDNGGTGAFV